jgi:hypothetical protein
LVRLGERILWVWLSYGAVPRPFSHIYCTELRSSTGRTEYQGHIYPGPRWHNKPVHSTPAEQQGPWGRWWWRATTRRESRAERAPLAPCDTAGWSWSPIVVRVSAPKSGPAGRLAETSTRPSRHIHFQLGSPPAGGREPPGRQARPPPTACTSAGFGRRRRRMCSCAPRARARTTVRPCASATRSKPGRTRAPARRKAANSSRHRERRGRKRRARALADLTRRPWVAGRGVASCLVRDRRGTGRVAVGP